MKGLTLKDKELIDYLHDYCRYSTKQLSKALHLPQQTISYKIKRLEEQDYIRRYDTVLNWNVIPLIKVIYYYKDNSLLSELEKEQCVHNLHEHIGTYSMSSWCFFKTNDELVEFENKYPYDKKIVVDKVLSSKPTIFGTDIKLKKPLMSEKQMRLDEIDVKLIKHLSNGNARDSILKISKDLGISYDVVHYRLKNLIRNEYFTRLIPQLGDGLGGLKMTKIIISFDKVTLDIVRRIEGLDFSTTGAYSDKEIYTFIISTDFEDYLDKLHKLHKSVNNEQIKSEALHWKKMHVLNRYPLEYIIE